MKSAYRRLKALIRLGGVWAAFAVALEAQVIFTDTFDTGASALWENQRGNWVASNGVYSAQLPNNNPPTYSALRFVLTNFTVDVDINAVGDGGIWLRADTNAANGVILVTGGRGWGAPGHGGDPEAGRSLYWHVVVNNNYGAFLNEAHRVFTNPGVQSVHLQVRVRGDGYAAYLNGEPQPVTALTNDTFTSGRVGLYDYSSQTFDNVVLRSEEAHPLRISLIDRQRAILSWSTNATGCTLESADALPAAAWNAVTNPPAIQGPEFTVPVDATRPAQFFRLREP